MKKGIGKAMETGIGPFRFMPEDVPEKEVSVLSSPKRLSVLFFLLNRPCAPISSISENLGMSSGSVRWHLSVLASANILEKERGRYFVKDAVLSDHLDMFVTLNTPLSARIAGLVIQRGPLEFGDLRRALKSSPQLLRYHIGKLEKSGMLKSSEGMYEIGFDLMEFQRTYGELMERTLARIAMDAKSEGLSMEIDRRVHCFTVHIYSPVELSFEVDEVPFYQILG